MATRKKKANVSLETLRDVGRIAKRQSADWHYAYPDDRNRLIEEARELIHGYLYCADKGEGDYKLLDKAARKWLRETKA